jgi:hypothetical protein
MHQAFVFHLSQVRLSEKGKRKVLNHEVIWLFDEP